MSKPLEELNLGTYDNLHIVCSIVRNSLANETVRF